MEINIIQDYLKGDLSLEEVAAKYKMGKLKLKKILEDNNIPIRKKGNQIKYVEFVELKIPIEGKILSCKKCGKEMNDVENKSGRPISHIQECYPEIEIPTKFKRSMYLKTKGEYWHFQYYDLIDKKTEDSLKCPLCNWETYDVDNKTGSLTKHIQKEHGSVTDFIEQYPKYGKYFNVHILQQKREKELKHDFVTCKVCGEKLKYVNNKHLLKHGLTLTDYKIKYLGSKFVSNQTTDKLKITYENSLKYVKNNFTSSAQIEITELIEKNGYNVINNSKKELNGVELDVYVPDLNIAFEYNGLYYHTEKMGKDKNYHLNKYKLAKERGIKLYQIFEDEWTHNKEICIIKILHIIKKNYSPKIYGRLTVIKKINKDIADIFLNKNHLQGSSPATTINYGAYYDDNIVGVMSFLDKNTHWELVRYATNINYRCIGLSSKMFKYFLKNNLKKDVISFADIRWTPDHENNLYTKLGFNLSSINKPDYKYVNGKISRNKRMHKFNFRKKNLLKKHPNLLNENMSESEMVNLIGCEKIWDCGLLKYIYTNKKP
jgi:hypothetical protein